MSCPDPTPGSVTGQSGIFTGLVDAELVNLRVPDWQWQYPVRLASTPGICLKHRAGSTGSDGETRLIVAMLGYHVLPGTITPDVGNYTPVPYPPTPITVTPHVGLEAPAGSGFAYAAVGTWIPQKGSQQDAPAGAGSVTWTYVGDDRAEGSYDLTFKAGQLAGSFVAPFCVLC